MEGQYRDRVLGISEEKNKSLQASHDFAYRNHSLYSSENDYIVMVVGTNKEV